MVIPAIAPYIEYIKIRVENVNLCESNVAQIFILKSSNKWSTGS